MTVRSTFVTQSLIDEYLSIAEDKVKWGRMWSVFFQREQLLSGWARNTHEQEAETIVAMYNLPEDALEHIANALDAAFMTGLFVGERRLEVQRGESDWIREAYDAPSSESDR